MFRKLRSECQPAFTRIGVNKCSQGNLSVRYFPWRREERNEDLEKGKAGLPLSISG